MDNCRLCMMIRVSQCKQLENKSNKDLGQNIWIKVKKSSKIGQDQEIMITAPA